MELQRQIGRPGHNPYSLRRPAAKGEPAVGAWKQKKTGHPKTPRKGNGQVDGCRSGRRRRLRRSLLFHFLDPVYQVVGLLLVVGAFTGALDGIGLAAIEQVQVGHGVIVIGAQLNRLLQVGDAFVNETAVLRNVVGANRPGERIGIFDLLADVLLVVIFAQFAVGAKRQGPVDDPDPVVGLGILGLQLDVLLVVGLGLLKKLGLVGRTGHLEKNRADAVDGVEVVGVVLEDVLEFLNGLFADVAVLLGRSAGT